MSVEKVLIGYLDKIVEGLPSGILIRSGDPKNGLELNPEIKDIVSQAANTLDGTRRRIFMAKTVTCLGKGGQRKAEKELGWDRGTVRKGIHELTSGITCLDHFSGRGRKPAEHHLPDLLEDITAIAEPTSQADPTFRTIQAYTPLTAKAVHNQLLSVQQYSEDGFPCIRTINTKLNQLKFRLHTVAKAKPLKKIAETDAIFKEVHRVNQEADSTDGVLRISCDTKAKVKVGPFSRGGKGRKKVIGVDHDFKPKTILTPFGILLPAQAETFMYYTQGPATPDFMVDVIEDLWPSLKNRFSVKTLVINMDNGPENSSRRTQFIKRIVDFAYSAPVNIRLAYYPPYHSKYNLIERVWGILENHWKGEILDTVDKVLGVNGTMTWKGKNPTIKLIGDVYQKGIKLTKREMAAYESKIQRKQGLEKWFVDITPTFS